MNGDEKADTQAKPTSETEQTQQVDRNQSDSIKTDDGAATATLPKPTETTMPVQASHEENIQKGIQSDQSASKDGEDTVMD